MGCTSVGRGARRGYEWSGETFVENPVSLGPYFLGLGVGALVAAPLCLISWPLTELSYPESGSEDDRGFAAAAPSAWLATGLGTMLGAVFYPLGLPFSDSEADDEWGDDGWDDEGDGDGFDGGPPGGDAPAVPPPWLEWDVAGPDGVPPSPFRPRLARPWEPWQRGFGSR
jgi:hypothetical protein